MNENAPSLSETVVTTVAEREGVEPTELTPLYEVVDPDALDGLFAPLGGSPSTEGEVTFPYQGYEVTAYSTGRVELRPADDVAVE